MPSEFLFTTEGSEKPPAAVRARRRIAEFMGTPCEGAVDLDRAVRKGLPAGFMGLLVDKQGYTKQELCWVIPPSTLTHRQAKGENFKLEESDRMMRAARLTLLAEEVFGDPERSERWMRKPLQSLEGLRPLEAMSTETGGQLVEELLMQLEFGHFA